MYYVYNVCMFVYMYMLCHPMSASYIYIRYIITDPKDMTYALYVIVCAFIHMLCWLVIALSCLYKK